MKHIRLLSLMVVGTISFSVYAQGLDAPVSQTPTVRSEIKNGYETAEICDNYQSPADRLDPCIARLLADYRVNHPSSAAFNAGLNIRKWITGARFVQIGAEMSGNRLARDYAVYGKVSAAQAETDLRSAVAELKITLEDAFAAASIPPEIRPKSVLNL